MALGGWFQGVLVRKTGYIKLFANRRLMVFFLYLFDSFCSFELIFSGSHGETQCFTI